MSKKRQKQSTDDMITHITKNLNSKLKRVEVDTKNTNEYGIKFEELDENMKISLMFNEMFFSMFANSNHMEYSARFLSLFLKIDYEYLLANLRLSNSVLNKEKVITKAQRCDYVAELGNINFNIEVNVNNTRETLERNISYAHKLFMKKVKVGSKYEFSYAVQLNINNFSFIGNNKIVDTFFICNDQGDILSDKLIFIQIYAPNLRKAWYTKEELSESERFLLSLIETNIEEANKIGMDDEYMTKAIEKQIELGHEDELLESYNHELAAYEQFKIDGYNEGFESGVAEGHASGLEEGQAKIIKSLLDSGMAKEQISEITKISLEDIEKIAS